MGEFHIVIMKKQERKSQILNGWDFRLKIFSKIHNFFNALEFAHAIHLSEDCLRGNLAGEILDKRFKSFQNFSKAKILAYVVLLSEDRSRDNLVVEILDWKFLVRIIIFFF